MMSFVTAAGRVVRLLVFQGCIIYTLLFSTSMRVVAEPGEGATGVRVNKNLSQQGVTLIPEAGNATVKLIDNEGGGCCMSGMSMRIGPVYCRIVDYW